MKPETEEILKQMGFLQSEDCPDGETGALHFFIPRSEFHIQVYPKAGPEALMKAIWNAGGEAKKKEIAKARDFYLSALS